MEVVPAGMSATTQCQKPLPVGACGSYIEMAKLSVPAGKPDQASCGEMSWPPGTPSSLESCSNGRGCPLVTEVLVSSNEGTCGR
jgi:hypothetical protein